MRRTAAVALVDAAGRLLLQERDDGASIDPDRWGQIVFVPPSHARDLDLTMTGVLAVPAFLDSDTYRRMRG